MGLAVTSFQRKSSGIEVSNLQHNSVVYTIYKLRIFEQRGEGVILLI
jgi:hypothetical protein